MKRNKIIISFFILTLFLISIATVSASDLNDTDNSKILKEAGAGNSFDSLNEQITSEKSKFTLENDYKFNNETDKTYSSGINITKNNFVIEGNNHRIDCNNQSRAFYISGKKVVINNMIIENGFFGFGSAINTKSQLTLNNVTFINCFGDNKSYSGGAVLSNNTRLNVNNCKFIDNGGANGASITSFSSKVTVANSTFSSSSDKIIKGQIFLDNSNLTVNSCEFSNTSSKYAAAIFLGNDGKIIISNTKFKNLYANMTAGAIGSRVISDLIISNCEFDNVSSENNGGAIFTDVYAGASVFRSVTSINNTVFRNCYSGFGGAILQLEGNLIIKNTNFTSNTANYEGGAIYTSHADVDISNSNFISNTLIDDMSYGGACYFDEGDSILKANNFENNGAYEGSSIYAYDNNLDLTGNYFNNPSDGISICTVYGKVRESKNNYASDVKSLNNTNYFYNFEGGANPLMIINNSLSFDKMPEKFDLRDYGWVTPVKDQGFMGACWAFGNMAALESTLLRYANKTYSLSVNNLQNSMLKYSKYGDDTISEGGNPYTAVAYLVDWLGVFPEEYDGYDELGKISSLFITPEDIHIQNAVVIPPLKTEADRNLLKNALINYGAAAVSHCANFDKSKYFNESSYGQYVYDTADSTHRVCVVGWDDNYSRYNFLKTPKGDGAWIVKNSWGTDWGDEGYFYLSYYDKSLADKESVCYMIDNSSYSRIYQNDVGGDGAWMPESKYYANVYTADEDELIGAVGTFFNETGREYEFTISVNDIDVYTQKGTSKLSGYETINLDKLVQIKKGDKFKVTFKNMLYRINNLRIHPQKGQSFVSDESMEWEDLAKVYFVAALKAYSVPDINITNNLVKYFEDDKKFVAEVGAGEEVTFEINGQTQKVKADENGLAKLDVNYNPGNYSVTTTYNNVSIVNYVQIKSTIESSDVVRGNNSDYDYKIQVLNSSGKGLNKSNVTISVNGNTKTYETDEFGNITIPFTKLNSLQNITVTNPSNSEVKTTTIKVVSRFANASNLVMNQADGSKFKVKVIGDDEKPVGKGEVVTIEIDKKTYKVKTDKKGYAILRMPDSLKPGTYDLKATYKGETIQKTVKVKPNPKNKDSDGSSKKPIVKPIKKVAKNNKINGRKLANTNVQRFSPSGYIVLWSVNESTIKFRVFGADGNPLGKGELVIIVLNNKTYKVKTDENGFATLVLEDPLNPGLYDLLGTYKNQTVNETIKSNQNGTLELVS